MTQKVETKLDGIRVSASLGEALVEGVEARRGLSLRTESLGGGDIHVVYAVTEAEPDAADMVTMAAYVHGFADALIYAAHKVACVVYLPQHKEPWRFGRG